MRKEAISIRLSKEVLHELDQFAESNRMTRSKVLEKVATHFLQQRAITKHEIIRSREKQHG